MADEDLRTGADGRTTRSAEKPTTSSLVLRPFGYLLIGSVWLMIWIFALGVPAGSVIYLVLDEDIVNGLGERFANPIEAIAVVVLLVPLMALIMGPGAIWHLPTAAWPPMVLSYLYAVRSLRPSYAGEKLSFSSWSARGSTFGPPTAGDVSMSLQPVRRSGLTDLVMRFYVSGWDLEGRMFLAMLPAGFAWSAAVVAFFPGLPDPVHLVFRVVTALLLLSSAVLGFLAFRARFYGDRGQS
ncbi:hypothetical protein ACFS27_27980 [Promicromonospora vindobonensis]|uniref:RDD family protein n=1 Tax=Promicromonospora vindobonensis TaxID=195748 RepID=A0ABW5W4F5_9MICO